MHTGLDGNARLTDGRVETTSTHSSRDETIRKQALNFQFSTGTVSYLTCWYSRGFGGL